jgi:DNA-directed RNA polymerase I and III subunit RPAC1
MSMPHVSDGTLPAHVEEQRTRVAIHNDAPRSTATVEAAGAYFASGVDNSFSIERFRRDLKIEVQSLDEEEIVFDIIGIDAAIANAFRRILIAEVPTMAIDKVRPTPASLRHTSINPAVSRAPRAALVCHTPLGCARQVFVLNNTSMTEDEVLAHRLGLIPIKADPRLFRECVGEEDPDEHHVVAFRLDVKCERAPAVGGGGRGSGGGRGAGGSSDGAAGEMINSRVLSGSLLWVEQGDQADRFRDVPIRPVHDDILIAKLRPGQHIKLEAWCVKGTGKTHAKWSPVATASYRLLPEVSFKQKVTGDLARELVAKCPMGVFDIEDIGGVLTAVAARPRSCSMCRECIRDPAWDERVKLARVRDHFIFSVESTGIMPPEVLFGEATKARRTPLPALRPTAASCVTPCCLKPYSTAYCGDEAEACPYADRALAGPEHNPTPVAVLCWQVLMQKTADLGQLLKDAVVGQGGGGPTDSGVQ